MTTVESDVREGIAVISLNRPERRNALSLELARDVAVAVASAGRRDDVHAVVITGTGSAFCAGADRAVLAAADAETLGIVYRAFHAVWECPVPTVAAIGGAAVGAGLNLALAADVRLVTPGALLDPRFMAIPVHPGGGFFWMMDQVASTQTTAAVTLLGVGLSGEEAVRHGLAWECVPDDRLVERAREICAAAAATPRSLLVRTKATWRREAAVRDLATASDMELSEQLASMATDAYRASMGGDR